MPKIADARIAILATDGYERSELRRPLEELRARGRRPPGVHREIVEEVEEGRHARAAGESHLKNGAFPSG